MLENGRVEIVCWNEWPAIRLIRQKRFDPTTTAGRAVVAAATFHLEPDAGAIVSDAGAIPRWSATSNSRQAGVPLRARPFRSTGTVIRLRATERPVAQHYRTAVAKIVRARHDTYQGSLGDRLERFN